MPRLGAFIDILQERCLRRRMRFLQILAAFPVLWLAVGCGATSGTQKSSSPGSPGSPSPGIPQPVAPGPPGQGIPPQYFGLNLHPGVLNGNIPWPTIPFGSVRLWDTGTTWAQINTSEGVYDFSVLDNWLNLSAANGKTDFLYVFGVVPPWASSDPSDPSCVSNVRPAGSCDPPSDLNADGSGTDQFWQDFVRAIVTHAAGKIKYWEIWNEPDVPSEWTGTMAQMARMSQDAYSIIKAVDPNAMVTTPTPVNDGEGLQTIGGWMSSYFAGSGENFADIVTFHGYVNAGHGKPVEDIVSIVDTVDSHRFGALAVKPLWDTESSWGKDPNFSEPDLQAAFLARDYLLHWSNGVERFYWYQYGNTQSGTLWTDSGLTLAGIAYAQVYDWMVGATMPAACSARGSVWTCDLTKPGGIREQAVWDVADSCSNGNCTTSTYTPDATYTKYADLAGNLTSFTQGTAVHIGAKPILLENK